LAFNPKHGAHCAVLIDRLAGLRSAEQLTAVPARVDTAHSAHSAHSADAPNPSGHKPAFVLGQWADAEGRVWQEFDLAALARNEQFLAIAA
jgi:twitching motility protein PilI